jgi:DNA-binding IclR family transcriptional regulator
MPDTNSSAGAQPDPQATAGLVPAVERAAAVLRYLQENSDPSACTVTRIAKALAIHKSTCSYILRTLEAATLVEYDPPSKAYMLGAALIGLGATATRRRDILMVGLRPIETLVRETGLSCVTFTQLPNRSFLIIAKTDSSQDIKVTIDVGQYFAPGTPALARIAMACMDREEVDAYIADYCQSQFTPATKSDRAEIFREVAQIQTLGYAVSQSEYFAGNTVVAAPIFTMQDEVCRGICLIGFTSQMKERTLPGLGEKVKSTAQAITQAVGGHSRLKRPAAKR